VRSLQGDPGVSAKVEMLLMSSHYKIEVHLVTPGETDDEDSMIQEFAERLSEFAGTLRDTSDGSVVAAYVQDVEQT